MSRLVARCHGPPALRVHRTPRTGRSVASERPAPLGRDPTSTICGCRLLHSHSDTYVDFKNRYVQKQDCSSLFSPTVFKVHPSRKTDCSPTESPLVHCTSTQHMNVYKRNLSTFYDMQGTISLNLHCLSYEQDIACLSLIY